MAGTEPQQIPAGQPAVFTQAAAPPSYSSLPADQQKQQPPTAQQQQVPVQQLQQGVPFQAWPQGQVYQQPAQGGFPQQGPVQYIAVSYVIIIKFVYPHCTVVWPCVKLLFNTVIDWLNTAIDVGIFEYSNKRPILIMLYM